MRRFLSVFVLFVGFVPSGANADDLSLAATAVWVWGEVEGKATPPAVIYGVQLILPQDGWKVTVEADLVSPTSVSHLTKQIMLGANTRLGPVLVGVAGFGQQNPIGYSAGSVASVGAPASFGAVLFGAGVLRHLNGDERLIIIFGPKLVINLWPGE